MPLLACAGPARCTRKTCRAPTPSGQTPADDYLCEAGAYILDHQSTQAVADENDGSLRLYNIYISLARAYMTLSYTLDHHARGRTASGVCRSRCKSCSKLRACCMMPLSISVLKNCEASVSKLNIMTRVCLASRGNRSRGQTTLSFCHV